METLTPLAAEKQALRRTLQATRNGLTPEAMREASIQVTERFMGDALLRRGAVAGYVAMRHELDVLPLLKKLNDQQIKTCLPTTKQNKHLMFSEWNFGGLLVVHPTLKIQEPPASSPPITPATVLVPLLAFDASGYRLGYGGGYYDRTMAAMRQSPAAPLFIGVGYRVQQVEHVPNDAHDQRLDGVITELGIRMF
jgi:5-formyltetrahydrofolate cyclo-ligase